MGQALMRSVSRLPWHSHLRGGDSLREQSLFQEWAVLRGITTFRLGMCHKRHFRQHHLGQSDHASKRIAAYCFLDNTIWESKVFQAFPVGIISWLRWLDVSGLIDTEPPGACVRTIPTAFEGRVCARRRDTFRINVLARMQVRLCRDFDSLVCGGVLSNRGYTRHT